MGPDAKELRRLAEQATAILAEKDYLMDLRQDWQQRELVIVPSFNDKRASLAGVSRNDLAQTLDFATQGVTAGSYREGDESIPIIVRPPESERLRIEGLGDRMIWSSSEQRYVPVEQVIDGFSTQTEEALIKRRNRKRTLAVPRQRQFWEDSTAQ